MISRYLWALASGALFAAGLVLGGMTQPAKVLGFLDIGGLARGISSTAQPGYWDPSLAFVMGGALCVSLLAFWLTPRRARPLADTQFHLPTRNDVDAPLLVGGALFGIGWGLAGYCPGPVLASLLTGGADTLIFASAMVVGMWVAKRFPLRWGGTPDAVADVSAADAGG
jgi:uncharacterized membrane protein YedE/YeeE